jgi:hypothetical protein
MNFLQLQNSVLADRFSEGKRTAAKDWINYRYGRLWAAEPWSFKLQANSLTLPMGSNTLAKPANTARIIGITDASIAPMQTNLDAIRPEDFYALTTSISSYPKEFTVIGSNIVFDRPAVSDRSITVLSEIAFTPLVADGDTPLIPVEFHLALASGAAAVGLKQEADPSWQGMEQEWQDAITDMKAGYLTAVTTFNDFYPSWP